MSDPYQPGQYPEPSQQQPQPGYAEQPYPQQGYAQGYPQAPYPPAGYGYPAYAPEPPGKTMGIVGFVLAFVVAPAGIVVSAMALSESKKVGYPNVLGKWGLWLSIAFTALAVLYVLFIVLAVFGGLFAAFSTTSSFEQYGMSV
ncbi:hypothetical protein AAG589_18115 [Isoptericola sp. F-RaC21]|uniref:hypothetical protein n=1 Tax=Isoptericola sp. F-RaC21 TaxID=3141452 RepID=UPI00315B4954